MYKKYATPLYLEFHYPRYWFWALIGIQLLIVSAVISLHLSLPVKTLLLIPCLWWCWLSLKPWFLTGNETRVHSAVWREDDEWMIRFMDGRQWEARMQGDFFQQAGILQLGFCDQIKGRYRLLILPGMLRTDDVRRLRVRLRLFVYKGSPPGR